MPTITITTPIDAALAATIIGTITEAAARHGHEVALRAEMDRITEQTELVLDVNPIPRDADRPAWKGLPDNPPDQILCGNGGPASRVVMPTFGDVHTGRADKVLLGRSEDDVDDYLLGTLFMYKPTGDPIPGWMTGTWCHVVENLHGTPRVTVDDYDRVMAVRCTRAKLGDGWVVAPYDQAETVPLVDLVEAGKIRP